MKDMNVRAKQLEGEAYLHFKDMCGLLNQNPMQVINEDNHQDYYTPTEKKPLALIEDTSFENLKALIDVLYIKWE